MNPKKTIQNMLNIDISQKFESISYLLNELFEKMKIEALFAITATILALLIPLAIFMIETNGSSEDGSVLWDKMVIFTQVIHVKLTVFGIMCITIPLVFWGYEEFRLIIIILFFVGQGIMVMLLNNCYKWIISKRLKTTNYRNKMRLRYLDRMNNTQEIKETWQLVWESEKNRVGMNEKDLVSKFFHQLKMNKDYKDKGILLSTYVPNMEVKYDNQNIIEDFLYSEIEQEKVSNPKNYFYKVRYQQMYQEYSKQSLSDEILLYQFNERLNKFIICKENSVMETFINTVGFELLETMRWNYIENIRLEKFIQLKDFFPENLNFEKNKESEEKQKIIFELFINWIIKTKALDDYKNGFMSSFADELLKIMFDKINTTAFASLINFSNFLKNSVILENNDKEEMEQLKMYALKKQNLVGLGRIYDTEIGDLNNVENKYKLNQQMERKWTYSYILASDNRIFSMLKNKEYLKRKQDMIKKLLEEDTSLDENIETKLVILENVLNEFLHFENEN